MTNNNNMAEDILKTSEEWQALYPNVIVLDPDGWDRNNYDFSWKEEKITFAVYQERTMRSTCIFTNKQILLTAKII